jgi:predicted helicase
LLPVVSKEVKGRKKGASEGAIFRTFSNGIQTKKDEWLYDFCEKSLAKKTQWFFEQIGRIRKGEAAEFDLKWDREIERRFNSGAFKKLESRILLSSFRPFTAKFLRYDPSLISILFKASVILPFDNKEREPAQVIGFHGMNSAQPFASLSVVAPFDICLLKTGNGSSFGIPRFRYTPSGERIDNITDWAMATFTDRYGKTAGITRDGIFAYVYAALHDPLWRETYAINLKREFPRIPLHPHFGLWAGWGQRLLDLHIGYEVVAPWPLTRRDTPDERARSAGLAPKVILKSDPAAGTVTLDSETVLSGIPAAAWDYRLGNRSAIDRVLDQHKEKTPKDPTIRAKFNTYRFANHKDRVADLLARVVRVSVETMGIVAEIAAARRG